VDGEVQDDSGVVDMTKATESIRIDGFTRPLPTKSLQDLLAKYGTVVQFWLQGIKKFCLVTYENKEQASAVVTALDGVSWPEETRPKLTVSFVTPQEVQAATSTKTQAKTEKGEARPTKALDELFRRTKAKPAIYWLPVNAEEAAKKEAKHKSEKETPSSSSSSSTKKEGGGGGSNKQKKSKSKSKSPSSKEKKTKKEEENSSSTFSKDTDQPMKTEKKRRKPEFYSYNNYNDFRHHQ